jgi:hypothetical protein
MAGVRFGRDGSLSLFVGWRIGATSVATNSDGADRERGEHTAETMRHFMSADGTASLESEIILAL